MAEDRRIPRHPFGFQDPAEEGFGRLAADLLARAEAVHVQRRREAWRMVVPAVFVYLLFALGVGAALWTVGIELRPVPLALAATMAFLVMAALGEHYEQEADWGSVVEGAGRLHRRLLGQVVVVKLLTGAFFTLPYLVMRHLAALFPRPLRLDVRVLALATDLTAALDEPVTVADLETMLSSTVDREVLHEAVLLVVWAGVGSLIRRGTEVVIQPEEGARDRLVAKVLAADPYVVNVSALG